MDRCHDLQVDLWINNCDISTKNYTDVYDPGRLTDRIGRAPVASVEDVDRAVQAAHQAFLRWRKLETKERIAQVMSAAGVLKASIAELAPLLVSEHGGLLREANMDFMAGYNYLEKYSGVVAEFMEAEQSEDDISWISIEKIPKGVVVAIVPWNMPVVLTMMKLAPALMTGNTIVVKPSPNAPLALTLLLKRMSACLPDGVINVVHGDEETGTALTRHELVKKVAFTGGSKTGKKVMNQAAASFKAVTLELGGNDPAILLDDVNLEEIMPRLLRGIFTRTGQVCYAVKRLYVPEKLCSTFIDSICDHINEFKVGHGLDERASLGPVNNASQLAFLCSLVENARSVGCKVYELGTMLEPENWSNGYYIRPHVVLDRDHTSQLVGCEQFGPVIPITPYRTLEEALTYANASEYGLASSVWSGDFDRAVEVAREIEAGLTFINTHGLGSSVFGMPFGGIKSSGIGRESSVAPTLSAYTDYHALRYLK